MERFHNIYVQQIEYTGIRNRNSLKLVIVFDLITKEELAQFVGILKSLPLGGKATWFLCGVLPF